jgi:class 3 adenylate cyclase
VGSAVNIWYNITNIEPLLTPLQRDVFVKAVTAYNALFSDWTGRADHADAALDAGREMLDRLAAINARISTRGNPPLAIGVGIHTGRAVVGSIGSPRRLEYTAIGDTVNVASRVEGLTKTVGQPEPVVVLGLAK